MIFKEIKNSVLCLVALTIITGIAYPALITVFAQLVFPHQANGNLLPGNGGSELIGQTFDQPKYFWGRLSACGYNGAASSGSNFAMTNPALLDAVNARIAALKAADPENRQPIPVDLVTASGSGLDPQISVESAQYQIARVARARGMKVDQVQEMVEEATQYAQFGLICEPVVNVVRLNILLDTANSGHAVAKSAYKSPNHLARSSGFLQ